MVLVCILALSVGCSPGTTVTKDSTGTSDTADLPGIDNSDPGDWLDDLDLDDDSDTGFNPFDIDHDEDGGGDGDLLEEVQTCQGPGEFLCPCDDNSDCISGYCIETVNGKLCTSGCVEDCPPGWACVQDQLVLPDVLYICLPQNVYLCRPCVDNDVCHSQYANTGDLCVSHGDNGSFCGVDCSFDGECPNGYVCAEVLADSGVSAHQCVPSGAGGECECSLKDIQEGASTPCKKINGYGECEGERVCGPDGLTECSATDPKPEECNGEDDNCDGEIDPSNSLKCITWYYDQDGDGFGIGAGACECEPPGVNYVSQGGDCDDSNVGVHPDITEGCNLVDDDCDGLTDESFAEGCETVYFDGDGDGWGDAAITDCLCKESKDYKKQSGDCNNENPNTYPGADELCDDEDNNCDEVIDEENAIGCVPYYLDQDKDGYGLSDQLKCLCAKIGDYTAIKGGDCDDTEYNVHPTVVELCDGVDNDCDGEIDEGEAVTSCGIVAHGEVACDSGCVITSCEGGFFDLNSAFADGCECQVEGSEIANQACNDADFLGVLPDSAASTSRTGKIVPVDDADWYKFTGEDSQDLDNCDLYHVRVRFLKNPNDAYVFDVYLNGCGGAQNLCSGSTVFEYMTDYYADTTQPGAPGGECPCMPDADHNITPDNFKDDTDATHHQCLSQTADYYVRVFRKEGAPVVCDDYQIEFSNGIKE
jgi:hypothetical protein